MIDRNYKTISPSLAKKRISKLVKAEREAWSKYKEAEELNSKVLSEVRLTKWLGYRHSLETMGITTVDSFEE